MPPTKKGTLYKKRDVFKGYRPRLFVLDPPILHYYLDASDPAPRKSIFLTGCTITPESWGDDSTSPGLRISHPSTSVTYHLGTHNSSERDSWISSLTAAAVETPPSPRPSHQPSPGFAVSPKPKPSPSLPRYLDVPTQAIESLETAFHQMEMLSAGTLSSTATDKPEGTDVNWNFLFEKKGVTAATVNGANVTVRGDSIMNQPPLKVFQTVINVFCKEKYDNQMDSGKRLTTYNPHTFVDYLKFKPVWPTSVRDFCNVVSWKVEGEVITIAAVEFEDGKLCPKVRGNVRGTCLIGGWTIRKHVEEDGSISSKVQIVVSSDLKGGLPSSIVQVVTQQQAMFPVIIGKWIKNQVDGREHDESLNGNVNEENVLNVVVKLPKALNIKHKPGESEHDGAASASTSPNGTTVGLMGCGNGGTGSVKCDFNVDLKKVLRFIETKKSDGGTVAVTHIALKALALALREYSLFNGRNVRLPILGVEGYYPNASVDVSTAAGLVANGSSNIVKVEGADEMSIKQISKFINDNNNKKKKESVKGGAGALLPNFLKKPLEILSEQLDLKVPGLGLSGRRFGTALVVTSPNNEGSEVNISADLLTPYNGKPSGPSIILVVGGVKILPSFAKEPRSAVARPVLTVSCTVGCEVANVASCRVLVERVQELMREPERMDKM
ncbi:hypothetical protein TL16_g12384 [Triparma laevis f. inornata]|uniref:PH domain-containing protein n=1 Tax=Triparma laevis f. inornata TaxID=1714386 RepID=A0A9W7BLF7_9STRA|nr:hypothetical protein TL16_g12384 [Triparma laevis f. inornata]